MMRDKNIDQSDKTNLLDRVQEALQLFRDLSKEGDQYKPAYDKLDQEINEAIQDKHDDPNIHIQGLAKIYPKFLRVMSRLKKINNEMLQQLTKGNIMKSEVADSERAEDMTNIANHLNRIQKVLSGEVVTKVEQTETKFVSPARRMTRFEIQNMREEEKDNQKDLDIKIDQLQSMIEEFNQPIGPPQNSKIQSISSSIVKSKLEPAGMSKDQEYSSFSKKKPRSEKSDRASRDYEQYDSSVSEPVYISVDQKNSKLIEPVDEYVEMPEEEANIHKMVDQLINLTKGLVNSSADAAKHA